ncbi:MAG: YukJ family protein [Steroidobacteraceae bacterium]|nr:YukJ family protein [Steroidobacteraceae bacterium]
MALRSYGVLKGKAIEVRLGAGQSPHYQVRLIDDTTDYRIAVNVKSQLPPSDVEYIVIERFQHPITALVEPFAKGFRTLERKSGSGALDFIRGNLFDRAKMRPLPFSVPGFDNDLNEKIDRIMQRAVADEAALVYAFGERWGPEPGVKDKYFGFLPGNGIHDIHMNQGNADRFVADDGVYQDGGLLVHFPDQQEWTAVFLKFQSQTWHTDDLTGHRIGEPQPPVPPPGPPTTEDPEGLVRIVAALVNPTASPEVEVVTLLNTAPHGIDLAGWALLDTQKQRLPLAGVLAAGATRTVRIQQPLALSNKGGVITLVDEKGLKVHGVSYTRDQARHPGWTIVF